MKRLLYALLMLVVAATVGLGQTNCVRLEEIDGSPSVGCVKTIKVTNGTLSCVGSVCTITISGGGGGTPGGADTQLQYNNAGSFGGITGATTNGTVVTLTNALATTAFSPSSNDAATLGSGTVSWSDLFLASGAVVNFANGNVVLTHSSGILTMGTGELRITTVGTNAASVPTLGSTSTLTNKTLASPAVTGNITASASSQLFFGTNYYKYLDTTGPQFSDSNTGFILTLDVQGLSADRTLTAPNASGTIALTSGVPAAANPTGTVGLAAVNGVATTFLRSDGAPALDQGITPTWTGAHAFSNTIAQSSTSATAFRSGASAATPSFAVDNSTASQVTGITVAGKGDGTAPTITVNSRTQITTALAGNGLAITADPAIAGNSVAGAAVGGSITFTAGAAARLTSGNANGGDINLVPGAGIGTGIYGSVWIRKPNLTGLDTYAPLKMRNPFNDSASRFISFYGPNDTTEQGYISTDAGNTGVLFSGTKGFFSTDVRVIYTTSAGSFINSNNLSMGSGVLFGWTSAEPFQTKDLILRRSAAASLAFGAADAASPVAQTMSVQNVVAGTTNTAGATWTHRGSLGTSQGAPGRIHLTGGAMIAASGTTQQTAVDRGIFGATKVLTNNSATTIVNVTNASNTSTGGVLDYCVEVFDGTDTQYECGMATYGISNKAGAFSGNTVTKFGNHQNATSGSLTVTIAISGADPGALSVNANSSLTPSTGYPRIVYSLRNNGNQAVAVQ